MRSRAVKLGVLSLILSYWSLDIQHGVSWQKTEDLKNGIVALHKGLGSEKIANTLKQSYSTVAKIIQWFSRTGSTLSPLHRKE